MKDDFYNNYWSDGIDTIDGFEIVKYLEEPEEIKICDVRHLCIFNRVAMTDDSYKRAMDADYDYPIIVSIDGGYEMIVDGNHRLFKAIQNGLEIIKIQKLPLKKCPEKFQMFKQITSLSNVWC